MVIAVIPSRYASSRFPGKPLVSVGGVPLLARVVRRVRESGVAERLIVATDDARIAELAAGEGVEARLDREPYASGSDRVAAAAAPLGLSDGDTVLNVQGDEPLVDDRVLRGALAALQWSDIGTVAVPADDAALGDEDVVKVEVERGMARAFARDALDLASDCQPLAHLGVYAFWAWSLRRFASLPCSESERSHGLEQLRALDHGLHIGVRIVCAPIASINRPEDVPRVERQLAEPARRHL
jgi:3-deoxy-manno-octulosonate cytidylyltransferase (CMP-KDO synthetase)